jgi:hypothetical protein
MIGSDRMDEQGGYYIQRGIDRTSSGGLLSNSVYRLKNQHITHHGSQIADHIDLSHSLFMI